MRRVNGVFLVGAGLEPQTTLETIFDSDCQAPVELFLFDLPTPDTLGATAELLGLIKKNLRGFVFARLGFAPQRAQLEFAYTQGIDLLDLEIDGAADWDSPPVQQRLHALELARDIFPRWAVSATLGWRGAEAPKLMAAMDELARRRILPLLSLDAHCGAVDAEATGALFAHLEQCWRRAGVVLRPLAPLIVLTTPLAVAVPRTLVGSLLGRAQDARLRAGSDLRRLLRVRRVEESFDSAGL